MDRRIVCGKMAPWHPLQNFKEAPLAERNETSSCCNSHIHCPICPKLHMFDSVVVIAPPTDSRKSALRDKGHPIHMAWSTQWYPATWHIISTCSLASHSGQRKWHLFRSGSVQRSWKFKAMSTGLLSGHCSCRYPWHAWDCKDPFIVPCSFN